MIERLKADFKQSMKDKDTIKKNVVQMLRANITNLAKEKRVIETELTQEDILGVISKELKQQNDSLEAFKAGNRPDLVGETEAKIDVIKNYLPKQLEVSEIELIIVETLNTLGIENPTIKDKGKLMKELMPKLKGKAEGKVINTVVEKFIK